VDAVDGGCGGWRLSLRRLARASTIQLSAVERRGLEVPRHRNEIPPPMRSHVRLNAPRGGRRSWDSVLLAGGTLLLALMQAVPGAAQQNGVTSGDADGCTLPFSGQIPDELGAFVLPGTRALCAAGADLNADGLPDYLLVLEKLNGQESGSMRSTAERPLLVVVRQPGGTLRVAARNDQVVYCAGCGGIFGDPFEGVGVGPGSFTVYHYGGSAWRWRADYTFRYARGAGTWRLTKVKELSYHTSSPDKMEETVFVAPDDFGDIDLARFHPERWKRPSARR
jgi:hypothetical protein